MQRRKKQKNELERWTERAAEGIIFRPDQREVERELLAHLEDKAADLARIFPDMEREEAEKRAVEQMGDPKEIGRALARLHRPWLGWLWRLSQIALAWAVLWSLREAVPDLLRGNQYWFQEQVYLSAQDCYLMGEDPYGPEGALTGEVPEAAERELVPQSFAHKILKKLARAGFVEVARGAEGGCRLSAELNRVTLYDLMTAMGEDSRLSSCMDPTYSCPWRASHGGCTVHCHLTGIQEKLNAELKAHTLEDILGPAD